MTEDLPAEGTLVVVRHEYGLDAGTCMGVMPGKRSGSWRDRQPKLIVKNGTCCAHVPVESIREWRAIEPAGK